MNQPGGWAYSIMFFMEAQAWIQQTAGLMPAAESYRGRAGDGGGGHHDSRTGGQELESDPADVLLPQSATGSSVWRARWHDSGGVFGTPLNATLSAPPYLVAKTDYAANGGTVGFNEMDPFSGGGEFPNECKHQRSFLRRLQSPPPPPSSDAYLPMVLGNLSQTLGPGAGKPSPGLLL